MKYIIIGLGNFGSVLAEELTLLGNEVVGVDLNPSRVEQIKDKVSASYIMDTTDEEALRVLPLRSVDVVVVAIGEAFGASIKTVALLKKNSVEHIYARALDKVHKRVLEAFDLDMILTPEKDAARAMVRSIGLNIEAETLKVDKEYYVIKLRVPAVFVGMTLGETSIEEEFEIRVLALVSGQKVINSIGVSSVERSVNEEFGNDCVISAEDYLVCYGTYRNFLSFWKTTY